MPRLGPLVLLPRVIREAACGLPDAELARRRDNLLGFVLVSASRKERKTTTLPSPAHGSSARWGTEDCRAG